jgi:hypothetical protein
MTLAALKLRDFSALHIFDRRSTNQFDAIRYCSNQGARLPSARELAQLSMSLGAKGFVVGGRAFRPNKRSTGCAPFRKNMNSNSVTTQ